MAITSAGFLEVEGLKGVWRVGVRGGVLEVQGEVILRVRVMRGGGRERERGGEMRL